MENIFCHIVGLNYKIKDKIIDILKSKDFTMDPFRKDKWPPSQVEVVMALKIHPRRNTWNIESVVCFLHTKYSVM